MPPIKHTSLKKKKHLVWQELSAQSATLGTLEELRRRYLESGELAAMLEPKGIVILDAFLDN